MPVISPAAVWASAGDTSTPHAHATTRQIESACLRARRRAPATRLPPELDRDRHACPDLPFGAKRTSAYHAQPQPTVDRIELAIKPTQYNSSKSTPDGCSSG